MSTTKGLPELKFWLAAVLLGCILASTTVAAPTAKRSAAAKSGIVPDPLVFVKQVEPNEKAFTILVPKGWICEGGSFFVDGNQVNGWANSIETKFNYVVKKDQAGTVMLHWLPNYYYCDGRYSVTRQYGMMQDGTYYNGMMVMNRYPAQDFLLYIVFPQLRPQAADVEVVEVTPLPELAAKWKRQAVLPNLNYDAVLVKVRYTENGAQYQEEMKSVIEDFGADGQGMWQNRETFLYRAPATQFKEWQGVCSAIYSSIHFDPQWVAAASRAASQRMRNARATQEYVNRVANEIVDNRRQVNAEIRHEDYLFLSGQNDYVNPYTNEVEQRPDGWKYHWQNGNGEIIMTNDDSYDPNRDQHIRRTDYKRSQVRQR